ncbi:solute carrier family 22 member 7-like [Dermacentor variabilis]|uniref:solute carrier family 22 member 7-like n=1 Tax=Dermacentor variabilis TaxID=34621 RepID=UPI003F5B3C09
MPGPRLRSPTSRSHHAPAARSTSPITREVLQEADPAGTVPAGTVPTDTVPAGTVPSTAPTSVLSSPLDHILIFGHGRFQKHVLLCTMLAFFTAIIHVRAPASLARPVDHWCRPPADYTYMATDVWKNVSVPLEADGKTRSPCLRYEPPFPLSGDNGNRTTVPCDAGWDYDIDADAGAVSIVVQWNLVCGRQWILRVLSTVYSLGGAMGAPLAGVAADTIGRRPVLCIWLLLLVFAGVSLAFARTILLFAILRAVLSAAVTGVLVTSLVVLFEVTDTQHRALFCSLAMVVGQFTATLYGEIVYNLEPSWRACQVAFMVPTSTLVLAVYLMDESPCWLLAVSNMRRAEQVLSWAACVNRADPDVFKERLSELKSDIKKQQDQQTLPGSTSPSDLSPDQEVHAIDLLVNRRLRKRSAVMFGCWFLAFAVFFSVPASDAMLADGAVRAVFALLKMTGILVDVPIIMRAGRRRSLAFGMVALSALSLAMAAIHLLRAPYQLLVGVVVCSLLVFDLCVVAMFLISAELYPTVVRASGLAFGYACGRLGVLASSFLADLRRAELVGAAYGIAAALLLHFGVMALGLPETTQSQPANTMRDMAAHRWALRAPLRVARDASQGGAKRKRSRSSNRERGRAPDKSISSRDKSTR